ncbi:phage head closure protein [Clostridium magnum]|uniref:Phage head-tail joining protein n=1 Tax=Clostridium magnum DSM 2767 TaxID=1121326 RepID=A0A162UWR9_9CLOT|nr:phage head closure protein [Clostridium magnum]KZL94364.1 phage head-tail joining protein [Clostridium magnum DSM 2767]SHJ49710.1 phage head-tail adaptor, putative, SPP1 family [Clostridium magnum DSM 2767]
MKISSLNKRITLQKLVEVENEANENVLVSQDFKTIWASIAPVKGREYLEAKKIQAELTYKITIRYAKDITPDMQIRYGERIFNIKDIIDPFEKHELLEIMCIEKVVKNG